MHSVVGYTRIVVLSYHAGNYIFKPSFRGADVIPLPKQEGFKQFHRLTVGTVFSYIRCKRTPQNDKLMKSIMHEYSQLLTLMGYNDVR